MNSNLCSPSSNCKMEGFVDAEITSDIILMKKVLCPGSDSDDWEDSSSLSDDCVGSMEESDDQDSPAFAEKTDSDHKEIDAKENAQVDGFGGNSNIWQSEVDDDLMQDGGECDAVSEPTLENCLYLNHMYQELILETVQEIGLLLISNREKQHLLQDQMKRARDRPTCRHSTHCVPTTPYFKDAHGHNPPANEDTIHKGKNGELRSLIAPCRPWSAEEKTLLIDAVKRNAFEKIMQPIMARKEILCMEINEMELTEKQKLQKEAELKTKEAQLLSVKDTTQDKLIGPINANYDWLKISAIEFDGTRSAHECELYWKNYLFPGINKKKWSKDEFLSLKRLVDEFGHNDWDQVAAALKTNRTALQCFEKYQTKVNPDCKMGKWTPEESERLLEIIDNCRIGNYIPWYQVAYLMDGRSGNQIRQHWTYNLNPQIRKGKWTEEEDLSLLTAVWLLGPQNWWRIKDYVPGRTSAQCNERWANTLDPSLRLGDWSKAEDDAIVKFVRVHGKKWSLLARQLKGRTDGMIRQRWKTLAKTCKPNEGALAVIAYSEAYRERLYRRLTYVIGTLCSAKRIGKRSDVTKECLKRLMSNMSASVSRNIKYVRSTFDQLLIRTMIQLPMADLKKLLNQKEKRKSVSSFQIDRELNEYFVMLGTKRKRGRPPKLLQVYEDDPKYKSMLEGLERAFQSPSTVCHGIPFLPPMARSLQAFRNMLLVQKHWQLRKSRSLPLTNMPSAHSVQCSSPAGEDLGQVICNSGPVSVRDGIATDGGGTPGLHTSQPEGNNAYHMLFARFASVFFWPAVLSTIEPEEEEHCPPVAPSGESAVKKKSSRKKKEKSTKKRKRSPTDNGLVEETAGDDVKGLGSKKKVGRPVGRKTQVIIPEQGVRRSSRHASVSS